MSYYECHVFFCYNQRQPGEVCCNNHGARQMRDYAKDRIKALKLNGPSKIRVDRKSTRLNSSHIQKSRMPSSA